MTHQPHHRRSLCLACLMENCEHSGQNNTRKHPRPPHVTLQQARIMRLAAEGLANKEIAARLGISSGTVKVYLSRLFAVSGLISRLQVALWAREHAATLTQFVGETEQVCQ